MEGVIFLLGTLVVLAGAVLMVGTMWLGVRVLLRRLGSRSGLEVATLAELAELQARVERVESRQQGSPPRAPNTGERTPPDAVPVG